MSSPIQDGRFYGQVAVSRRLGDLVSAARVAATAAEPIRKDLRCMGPSVGGIAWDVLHRRSRLEPA